MRLSWFNMRLFLDPLETRDEKLTSFPQSKYELTLPDLPTLEVDPY
jgi:hypothetical protein